MVSANKTPVQSGAVMPIRPSHERRSSVDLETARARLVLLRERQERAARAFGGPDKYPPKLMSLFR